MNEIELVKKMRESGLNLNAAETLEEKVFIFEKALRIVIKPKSSADKYVFRNVSNWLRDGCRTGVFDENSIFRRVLDFAVEASGPGSKNPAAVFMSILKKELGYKK